MTKGRERAVSDMTISKVMRDADLPYVPHGFRSSFRDWAAEQMPHIPDPVAEAALAHVVPDAVVRAYKRTQFLEQERDGAFFTQELNTQLFNGVSYGALLFLLGGGLSLIFGVMRIVNLSHGSYFLLGGYVAISVLGSMPSDPAPSAKSARKRRRSVESVSRIGNSVKASAPMMAGAGTSA